MAEKNQNSEKDCPLCEVSDESIKALKAKKRAQTTKQSFWQKLKKDLTGVTPPSGKKLKKDLTGVTPPSGE